MLEGRIYFLIKFIFAAIEAMFCIRIVFKLFGANAASPIVSTLYKATNFLLLPLGSVMKNFKLFRFEIDLRAIIGIFVYAILGFLVTEAFKVFFPPKKVRKIQT